MNAVVRSPAQPARDQVGQRRREVQIVWARTAEELVVAEAGAEERGVVLHAVDHVLVQRVLQPIARLPSTARRGGEPGDLGGSFGAKGEERTSARSSPYAISLEIIES